MGILGTLSWAEHRPRRLTTYSVQFRVGIVVLLRDLTQIILIMLFLMKPITPVPILYQRLIDHIRPRSLLGLTATPERTDGADIRQDFGGAFTHEIRLPEAIDRALLSPFHYFGIPDLDGLDFSTLAWRHGGYDVNQLRSQLEGNYDRAQWVMS